MRLLSVLAAVAVGSSPCVRAQTAPAHVTTAQQEQLNAMIASHERVRARFAPADQQTLDQLTAALRQEIFASPPKSNLLHSATQFVHHRIPSISGAEAKSLAEYALGGIASANGSPIGAAAGSGSSAQLLQATQQMQETQMSFNLQYLQLQSQMQSEDRSYTAVSNIMKTKHDTVKNSIANIH